MIKFLKYSFIIIILIIVAYILLVKTTKTDTTVEQAPDQNIIKTRINGSGLYTFDPSLSSIEWQGRKTFIENWVDSGVVNLKSGNITLDNNTISNTNIIVDMSSIKANKTGANSGEDKLSTHLKSADFFNIEEFPISQFALTGIVKNEELDSYTIKGDLTIKNITKSIEFPSVIYMSDNSIYLQADIPIDRSLFDVRFGSPSFFNDIGNQAIDNIFNLKIKLVATK